MYGEEILEVVNEYLRNPQAEYALMIDGEWGSGKTYFFQHSLSELLEKVDNGKMKRRKYAYVSLYGVKSIENISKEILFQYLGSEHKRKIENADWAVATASNILAVSLGQVSIDFSKLKKIVPQIDISEWIICFDDFERCGLSVNEVFGYINCLIEHNKCKVIILANEKEIGKVNLSKRLEDKYQVVLLGRKFLIYDEDKDEEEEKISVEQLQNKTRQLFHEDVLYQSIREKVIGLTIEYVPKMEEVYDSVISKYRAEKEFWNYLTKVKTIFLEYFQDAGCRNIRTMLSALGSIQKVYSEMRIKKYNTRNFFEEIMGDFLRYIILFTIYDKANRKTKSSNLTETIGYVQLGKDVYNRILGFKFLERYCTNLKFSQEEFIKAVASRQKYYEEQKRQEANRPKAYSELYNWFEKEDKEVSELISVLKEEIVQNKYSFQDYQAIIGLMMILQHYGHDVGEIDEVIDIMNRNIKDSEIEVDVERRSFSFEENPELREKYNHYIEKIKLQAGEKNNDIQEKKISECLESEQWAEELYDYCDKNFNDFIERYEFIGLLDINCLLNKIDNAMVKDLRTLIQVFKMIYKAENINQFFKNDRDTLQCFKEKIEKMEVQGIGRNLAKKDLVRELEDIIKRLE